MYLTKWYHERGARFVWQRGSSLVNRYGITSNKVSNRISALVANLAKLDCAPTFPTPGVIAKGNPKFLLHLQTAGAEIAVHGYRHLALNSLPVARAAQELEKAAQVLHHGGIEVQGFRCPYMAYTDELLDALPQGLFNYSSNNHIIWEGLDGGDTKTVAFFDTLRSLYKGDQPGQAAASVPWRCAHMIEIPVLLPDDLMLHDGLGLGPQGIAEAWIRMLGEIHQRGELFTVLFHTELADCSMDSLSGLLHAANRLQPKVWIARLRDISDWWKEKSEYKVNIEDNCDHLHVELACTRRATVLGRGLDCPVSDRAWDGSYSRLQGKIFDLKAVPRPLVGLPSNTPQAVLTFLEEQGYILDTGESATRCGIYIDEFTLAGLSKRGQLINHIERSTAPLIRFWRWPEGYKSALCITGDLDALSLRDYAARLPLLKWLA